MIAKPRLLAMAAAALMMSHIGALAQGWPPHHGWPPYQDGPIYFEPAPIYIGERPGSGTYAAAPRAYLGDPRDWRTVPQGWAPRKECYGGREQVLDRNGWLVWVPTVTCGQ